MSKHPIQGKLKESANQL
ncbi:hypothetical protein Bhyg_05098 [Pseudolycoriella hygida]|uniref:Uncharacterized protein n=1 Tax=Pseudolycoriella hygida TaxID=35572 RepID=A0A9Q0NH51_9DIPT|nr:hypothetical protein Bhyg_05098 [Pseudolycoriella hygida]